MLRAKVLRVLGPCALTCPRTIWAFALAFQATETASVHARLYRPGCSASARVLCASAFCHYAEQLHGRMPKWLRDVRLTVAVSTPALVASASRNASTCAERRSLSSV
jgi:hypothetical protein